MGSVTFGVSSIPNLEGKTFIVTGGNSGVGFETSRHLAMHGGHVIIATHPQRPEGPTPTDAVDGPGAVAAIKSEDASAKVEYMECDLASFKSIRSFVDSFKSKGLPLTCLINNAGLQTPPDAKTHDGFEITLGVNFFGPLYLTQLLLPLLKSCTPSRIVWVTSPEETLGETDWNDVRGSKMPTDIHAYANSKLWDLMVGLEMNDRLRGSGVESFVCHPGMCRTDLFRKADHDKMASVITDWAQWIAGQTAESGALPLLYCTTAPELEGKGGTYYGAYYKGPFTPNIFNTSQRTPGNAEANDPVLRARLYDAAIAIVEEVAGEKVGKLPQAGPEKAQAGPDKVQAGPEGATSQPGAQAEAESGGAGAAGGEVVVAKLAQKVSEGVAALGLDAGAVKGKEGGEGIVGREEGVTEAPAGTPAAAK